MPTADISITRKAFRQRRCTHDAVRCLDELLCLGPVTKLETCSLSAVSSLLNSASPVITYVVAYYQQQHRSLIQIFFPLAVVNSTSGH